MALYFISYDLKNERNYPKLYEALNDLDAVRILDSTWCLKRLNTSAKELRDHFGAFTDSDDGVIVSEVSEWASRNTDGRPNDL